MHCGGLNFSPDRGREVRDRKNSGAGSADQGSVPVPVWAPSESPARGREGATRGRSVRRIPEVPRPPPRPRPGRASGQARALARRLPPVLGGGRGRRRVAAADADALLRARGLYPRAARACARRRRMALPALRAFCGAKAPPQMRASRVRSAASPARKRRRVPRRGRVAAVHARIAAWRRVARGQPGRGHAIAASAAPQVAFSVRCGEWTPTRAGLLGRACQLGARLQREFAAALLAGALDAALAQAQPEVLRLGPPRAGARSAGWRGHVADEHAA